MNIFCKRILRSLLVKATSLLSAFGVLSNGVRSKNRYRHFTNVEGSDVAVII